MTKAGSAVTYRPQKYVCTITVMLQKTNFFKKRLFFRFIFTMMTLLFSLYDNRRNNRSYVRISLFWDFIKKRTKSSY